MSRMTRLLLPAAVAAVAAAAPAAASAATLETDLPCYLPTQPVTLQGEGWTPSAAVALKGSGIDVSAPTDAAGAFSVSEAAPLISQTRRAPRTFTVQATDPAQVAAASFRVVNGGAVWAGKGDPRKVVRWSFGGLSPDKPIYVHVRRGAKTLKTTRAGKAKGVCGTGSARLRRLPIRTSQVRPGSYRVIVDNRRSYRSGGLQYVIPYTVFTAPRYG
jgi:hypothetical protein